MELVHKTNEIKFDMHFNKQTNSDRKKEEEKNSTELGKSEHLSGLCLNKIVGIKIVLHFRN